MTTFKKKILVVAGTSHLSEQDFVDDSKKKAQAQTDNPTLVPGLDPTAAVVTAMITDMEKLISERGSLRDQIRQKTDDIKTARSDINDVLTNKWSGQIETAVGDDIGKIHLLGYKVKSEDEVTAEDSITGSHPIITAIDTDVHGQQTVHIINSKSGSSRLPKDARQVDIYEMISETEPADDLSKWHYLGIAKRGKFINHFDVTDLGKTVWYICVYISKSTLKPAELSGKVRATVS